MAQPVLAIVGFAIGGPVGAAIGPLVGATVEFQTNRETPDRSDSAPEEPEHLTPHPGDA